LTREFFFTLPSFDKSPTHHVEPSTAYLKCCLDGEETEGERNKENREHQRERKRFNCIFLCVFIISTAPIIAMVFQLSQLKSVVN
jgi:hypothetical protein